MEKISKYLYAFTLTSLLLILGVVSLSNFGNYKLLSVQSGSMSPAIRIGSMIAVKSSTDYKKGDVITFKSATSKDTTTHRIVEVKDEAQGTQYITKGDANNGEDTVPVKKDMVLGKMIFSVPLFGYFIYFTKTLHGFILLVIIPSTIIVFNEVVFLFNTIVKKLKKRKHKGNKWMSLNLRYYCLLLSIAALPLALNTQSSHAYLKDQIIIAGNSFTAGVFPYASLSLAGDKKTASFSVSQIDGYTKLSYELTYDTSTITQGVQGEVNLTAGQNDYDKTVDLATCTTYGTCTYHEGVHNFKLKIKLLHTDGHETLLEKSL